MQYRTLCKIKILHAYFLNHGLKTSIDVGGSETMSSVLELDLLRKYDFTKFLDIVPTFATKLKLKNHKMIIKSRQDEFTILAGANGNDPNQTFLNLEEDFQLTFGIYSKDPLFTLYTDFQYEGLGLEFAPRLLYFSNKPIDTEKNIFDNVTISASANLLEESDSRQMIYGLARESQLLGQKDSHVSIANIDQDELLEVENIEKLNNFIIQEKKKGLQGFIQLHANGDINDHNMLQFIGDHSVFVDDLNLQMTFKNRESNWHYFKLPDNLNPPYIDHDLGLKPHTAHGYVDVNSSLPGDVDYPNPKIEKIIPLVDGTYKSEIFI